MTNVQLLQQIPHVVFAIPSSNNVRDGLNYDINESFNAGFLWYGQAFPQQRIESIEMDTARLTTALTQGSRYALTLTTLYKTKYYYCIYIGRMRLHDHFMHRGGIMRHICMYSETLIIIVISRCFLFYNIQVSVHQFKTVIYAHSPSNNKMCTHTTQLCFLRVPLVT